MIAREIATALQECREAGMLEVRRVHYWGRVVCEGCGERWHIASTSRFPELVARRLRRFADRHREHLSERAG